MQHWKQLRKKQRDANLEYHQSVMGLIGTMTLTWAGIDLILSTVIEWHQAQQGTPRAKAFPRDTSRKLEYLQNYLEKDVRIEQPDRSAIRDIRLELRRLNRFRKSVVHGHMYQRNRRTTEWQVFLVKADGFTLSRRTETYTNDQILEAIRAMTEIAHTLSPFFARIAGIPHPANSP